MKRLVRLGLIGIGLLLFFDPATGLAREDASGIYPGLVALRDRKAVERILDSCGGTVAPSYQPPSIQLRQWLATAAAVPLGLERVAVAMGLGAGTGHETDAKANHGLLDFLRRWILSIDEPSFRGIFRFYSGLRELDRMDPRVAPRPGQDDSLNSIDYLPIEESSHADLWELANRYAKSPDEALLAMATYGHDNLNNRLTEGTSAPLPCRLALLEYFRPPPTSNLYRNGAIAPVRYPDDAVNTAEKIQEACNQVEKSATRGLTNRPCGEGHAHYQSDYYHVIASAFLACMGGQLPWSEPVYLDVVRNYKIDRFAENVDRLPDPTLRSWLKRALFWLRLHRPTDIPEDGTVEQRLRFQATRDRFVFEVGFRDLQHRLGWAFGTRVCRP